MIPAVTFTYAGDASLVPAWCELHRLVGLMPVVVEDTAAPLPPWLTGWLAARRINLRRSTFHRRGNLNGTDCAAGIAATLASICRDHGTAAAFKIDIDTAVVRPEIFVAVTGGKADIAGLTHPAAGRQDAYGMAYALSAPAAAAVADHLAALPLDPSAPEDRSIWQAAGDLALRRWSLRFHRENGPFTVVPPWADYAEAVTRFSVLTWGNPLPSQGRSAAYILTGLRSTQRAFRHLSAPPLPTFRHHSAKHSLSVPA